MRYNQSGRETNTTSCKWYLHGRVRYSHGYSILASVILPSPSPHSPTPNTRYLTAASLTFTPLVTLFILLITTQNHDTIGVTGVIRRWEKSVHWLIKRLPRVNLGHPSLKSTIVSPSLTDKERPFSRTISRHWLQTDCMSVTGIGSLFLP